MHSQDKALKFSRSNNNISSLRAKYEYYFRKVLVLLILVTLLSLLLSYFTGLSFLHSYAYYSSSFMIPYLNQTTFERKYMFVLCNGILVFLAGLHNRTSCSSLSSEFQTEVADNIHNKIMNIEEELMLSEEEKEPVLNEADQVDLLPEDGRSLNEEIELENEEERGLINVKEEEGDTESEGPGSNTEELNKKIEEFIRKMKEELQLEAQQQHIIAA